MLRATVRFGMDIEASARVESVPAAQWPRLAPFVFRHNRLEDGRVRCMHSEQGETEAAHLQELAGLAAESAAFWRIASEDGELLGVIGCELDASQARAWLRGPWTEPGPHAGAMAGVLLQTLEAALPAIQRFDAFPHLDEETLNALYRDAGYERMTIHRVMQAMLHEVEASPPDPRIAPTARTDLAHWLPLHHALFPGGYLSDDEIEAALGGGRRLVLTAWLQGRPAGYLVANDEPAMGEIYVDFIGVDPACRGRGLGRSLLLEALRWGRGLNRRHAALTVRQDREEALSLYRRCGLEQVSAGVHWRKDR